MICKYSYDSYRHRKYGKSLSGTDVEMPAGWRLLPEGAVVPSVHREFSVHPFGHNGEFTEGWCAPRRCRSTMTPLTAELSGHVTAYAVPE